MSISMYKFHRAKEYILGGDIRLRTDTLKLAILKPGFKYDKSMVRFSDVSGLEIESTLYYPAGGLEVSSVVLSTDTATGKVSLTIGDVNLTQIDNTIQTIVIYSETTANGIVNPLVCYGSFGDSLTFSFSAFKMSWPNPIMTW